MNVLGDTLSPAADVCRPSYGHDGPDWGAYGGPAAPATPRVAAPPRLLQLGVSGAGGGLPALAVGVCLCVLLHGCLWGHSFMCLFMCESVSLCGSPVWQIPGQGSEHGRVTWGARTLPGSASLVLAVPQQQGTHKGLWAPHPCG